MSDLKVVDGNEDDQEVAGFNEQSDFNDALKWLNTTSYSSPCSFPSFAMDIMVATLFQYTAAASTAAEARTTSSLLMMTFQIGLRSNTLLLVVA